MPPQPQGDPSVQGSEPRTTTRRESGSASEPVSPLVALRRHWVVGLAFVVVGTAVGAAVGTLLPSTYTAESRVAVGSNDLQALSVPGYVFAAQELAATTARYVDNNEALGVLRDVAGDDVSSVTASPIPDSNVIRLEVSAGDEDAAVSGAAALTDYLIEQSAQVNSSTDQDALLQRYTEVAQQVAAASVARDQAADALASVAAVGTPSDALQAQLVEREAALDVLQTRQEALSTAYDDAVNSDELSYQLVTVAEAAPSFDDATSLVQRYGLLGLVAGLLVALLAAVLLERRRRSPDEEAEDDDRVGLWEQHEAAEGGGGAHAVEDARASRAR